MTATYEHSIQYPLLITALIKTKAELELLRNEVSQNPCKGLGTKPSDKDVESHLSGTPLLRPPQRKSNIITASREISGASSLPGTTRMARPIRIPTTQHSSANSSSSPSDTSTPFSPLSPTFGPRMGHVPSGTVFRRRSLPCNVSADSTSTGFENPRELSQEVIRTNWERRMQWEAAWSWIETHLKDYVGELGACGDRYGTSLEVWNELVKLRTEATQLEEKLKGYKADMLYPAGARSSI